MSKKKRIILRNSSNYGYQDEAVCNKDIKDDQATLNRVIEIFEGKIGLLKEIAGHMEGWAQTYPDSVQETDIAEDVMQFRELLGESCQRSRELCAAIERRDKACKPDKFLPDLQLLLGSMHGGYDYAYYKKRLIDCLRSMLLAPVPKEESWKEQELQLSNWEAKSAKAECRSVFADMERLRRPVLMNRILAERILLELTSDEFSEQSLTDVLRECGIFIRYYEEVESTERQSFVLREEGGSYPAFFMYAQDSGELKCEYRGCHKLKREEKE